MAEDCRECALWERCPCGKAGHENGTSVGYSTGECKMYDPIEIARKYAPKFDKPVVDMAEVVRCRDCKWYREGEYFAPTKFCFRLKDKNGEEIGYNFASDDFCSYGERKDEVEK